MAANRALLALLALVGGAVVLQARPLASAALSNVSWVMLNRQMARPPGDAEELGDQQGRFARAVGLHADNQSARFGEGLALALQGQADEAIATWRGSGYTAERFAAHGVGARERGELDLALTQFRTAGQMADAPGRAEAALLAGTMCQRLFASQDSLSPANRDYCVGYWRANGDNLIVNGGFDDGSLMGWQGEHYFQGVNRARLAVEPVSSPDDFAVRLEGLDGSNHFGLFQRLSLSPGDSVRFSGRFRMAGDADLSARWLYVGWQNRAGKAEGNHAGSNKGSLEWTTFDRTFTVPDNSQGAFDFYPVLFSGVGDVWFDDIQLHIIGR